MEVVMEVTRNVIQDILPLYLAGEVSADTSALVEDYLKTDLEMAQMVKQAAASEKISPIPVSINKENAMEALEKTNKAIFWRMIGISVLIATIFVCALLPMAALFVLTSSKFMH
jgi:hypothetical protein